jgi:hypothetical protein
MSTRSHAPVRDLAGHGREQPAALEKQSHLQIEDLRVQVKWLLETPVGLVPGQQLVGTLDRLLVHHNTPWKRG